MLYSIDTDKVIKYISRKTEEQGVKGKTEHAGEGIMMRGPNILYLPPNIITLIRLGEKERRDE
jgi:hypothetical protein